MATPFDSLDDFIALPRTEAVALSPDGHTAVITVAALKKDATGYDRSLWSVPADGSGTPRRLTRSAKGCVIVKGGDMHEIPAAPVREVVDTTGAGDQFAAGFLYGLTHGKSLGDCGRLGALAAAEVISHYGARPEVSLKELAEKQGLL